MASIKISDLHPTGYELFADSESYMNQLNGDEANSIHGGGRFMDDWGDVIGYGATVISAAVGVGSTPVTSTWGCSLAAGAFSYQAFKESYD